MDLFILSKEIIKFFFFILIKINLLKYLKTNIDNRQNQAIGLSGKSLIFMNLIINLAIIKVFFI